MNNLIFMNSLKLKGHTEEFPSSSAESIPLGQPFTSRSNCFLIYLQLLCNFFIQFFVISQNFYAF